MDLDISFVIVSYNTAELIDACVSSILSIADGQKEIFVIDNHSTDSSVALIQNKFPQIHLIANMTNKGFGAANNQVLPLCRGRYVFFLNPDTQIQSKSIRELIGFMDDNPQIGLCGAKIIETDGATQWSVSDHYPSQRYASNELSCLKGTIACVLGAAMIARTDLIRKIGGFDEDFFLYGEDQDLCLRIRKAGYEIGYCDRFVVMHLGGQSERDSESAETWRRKASAEYLFCKKHYFPHTVRKILLLDLLKSYWRIATIKMLMPFSPDKNLSERKLAKYRAFKEMSKQFKNIGYSL